MDPLGELPLNRKRRTAEDDLGEGREHQLKPMSDRNPKCKCFIKSSLFFGPRQTVCYCHSLPEDTDLAPRIFFKFKDLPVNIRLKIWQHSWGPRDVGVVRCILGTQDTALQECDNFLFPQTFSGDRDLRIKHVQIAKHHWGVPPYSESNSKEFMSMKYQYRTITKGLCYLPESLQANHESRLWTFQDYQLGMAQTRGNSELVQQGQTMFHLIWEYCRVIYPLHCPLSTTFWMSDCRKLQRVSIPELVPTLPGFTQVTGRWSDDGIPFPKDEELAQGGKLLIPEFNKVWHLLRTFFPSLREITLRPFTECKRYHSTLFTDRYEPIDLEQSPSGLTLCDKFCHACLNMQDALRHILPPAWDDDGLLPVEDDYERLLDFYHIAQPVFKEKALVIGIAPEEPIKDRSPYTQRYRPAGPVTVTFRTISDAAETTGNLDWWVRQKIDWDDVHIKCVERTLRRAFGPPGKYDYMTYFMPDYRLGEEDDGIEDADQLDEEHSF